MEAAASQQTELLANVRQERDQLAHQLARLDARLAKNAEESEDYGDAGADDGRRELARQLAEFKAGLGVTASPLEQVLAESHPSDATFRKRRERAMTRGKSIVGSATPSPRSPAWRMRRSVSAVCSRDLVGMQPQLRQMPPRCSRSTSAVRSLS